MRGDGQRSSAVASEPCSRGRTHLLCCSSRAVQVSAVVLREACSWRHTNSSSSSEEQDSWGRGGGRVGGGGGGGGEGAWKGSVRRGGRGGGRVGGGEGA